MKKHLKKKLHHKIAEHHPKKVFYRTLSRKTLKLIRKGKFPVLTVRVIFITFILSVGYYFLFLKPKLAIPNALLEAEKALSVHYFNLIQNRLTYTELIKLEITSPNLEVSKDDIITKITKSNEDGLKQLENPFKIKKIFGYPINSVKFINKDLANKYPELLQKNRKIYEEQKKIIDTLISFDSKVSKLFSYHPESDLGSLDLIKQKEEALERIANAKLGLTKIKDDVSKLSQNNEKIKKLVKEIDNSITYLNNLEKSLQLSNYSGSQQIKNRLYNQFSGVKSAALEAELAIIKSKESAELLKDQTNIILEYEFWINKINYAKEGS